MVQILAVAATVQPQWLGRLWAPALAGALASGGIGPGRMSEVGLAPPLFGIAIAGEAGGGLLIGLSAPHLIEKVRQRRHRDDTLPE